MRKDIKIKGLYYGLVLYIGLGNCGGFGFDFWYGVWIGIGGNYFEVGVELIVGC